MSSETKFAWIVIHYHTYQQRWLRAICSTPESAELRKSVVQFSIEDGQQGGELGDKVFVERVLVDHLYGKEMHF